MLGTRAVWNTNSISVFHNRLYISHADCSIQNTEYTARLITEVVFRPLIYDLNSVNSNSAPSISPFRMSPRNMRATEIRQCYFVSLLVVGHLELNF